MGKVVTENHKEILWEDSGDLKDSEGVLNSKDLVDKNHNLDSEEVCREDTKDNLQKDNKTDLMKYARILMIKL
ncbi:hypothetical protein L5515_011388 [Caenorhabditis briggsae]|uniref:Uncharacterized protein n=1 Tax=Caenorhabditis briggsae TaxID=6238 RepID=A0AAE9AHB6_CAEBR|nr:hypothetical protein L3Y34_004268 [Caenorhabditis briggsae]UMM28628.1 hypothetical protein L5515_011388 [Caenorhabditis briggsae]